MLSFLFFAAILLFQTALTSPTPFVEDESLIGPRQGGYYWSFWQEGYGNFNCNNGAGGTYTVTWSGNGGFVCGKGWNPGGNRFV